ncbi:MAG: response regulator [Alphaproteobacteria bacterium]|nr:response regulator [Alphaproteobacteria bacterium]
MSERKRILVVEDNDFVRMQITKFLQDEGYETVESTDGSEALKQISNNIDFAIVDVRMEPVNGFEFLRIIRGDGIKTPVILVTGDDNPDILSESAKLGVAAVLKKPVQKDRLIKTVSRTLGVEKK